MGVLRIKDFGGVIPVIGDRALPDGFAAESVNTWFYGNELRGVRPPTDLEVINSTTRRVFRVPKRTVGGDPAFPTLIPPPSYLGDSVWMQFTDPDTDIVRGQLVEDSYERYYFCSPTTGPLFNTYARLQAGLPPYKLGVPGPDTTLDALQNNAAKPIISSVVPAANGPNMFEFEFKISDSAGAATSYSNPGGTGNRTATITVTSTTTWSAALSGLVDGNTTTPANIHMTDLSGTNKELRFDFLAGATKRITEFTMYQDSSKMVGTWEFQGSNNGTTWIDLGAVKLGGAGKSAYAFTNTAVYRYYRLFQAAAADPIQVTRSYLYTWVNEFGEESQPSLPAIGAGPANGVWTITNITDPAVLAGYANYTKKYLYRTITGASGQTTFYRVAEVPIGTTTYADDTDVLTDAILAGKLTLESTSWAPPPSTLEGFIAMPNGFLIGFDGSSVYMSESYHFHAWPADYKQATETPIVGLGVLGQTCVVCTQGYPATITGVKPATCAFTKSNADEPCLGRGSIVSTPDGVIYASQNGLILVGPGGIKNVTKDLITRDDWIRLYAPQYLRAARYQNGYLALKATPGQPGQGFFIDPTALKVALTEFSDFEDVVAINSDFWSGEVLIIEPGKILRWDTPSDNLLPTRWLSKEFQYQFKENFACYAIFWDDARYSSNNFGLSFIPADEKVRFIAYADRVSVYDEEVPANGEGIRLPSGFKSAIWQFEIRARAPVYSMHVASTMKELKSV